MTFALLLFAYLFSQFFRSFLAIVAADLTRDLGFGPAELGWLGSAWFMAFAFSQFVVGYLLDTIGPRRTMGGMMALGVLGALIFALSGGIGMSLFGMALIGVGCSPVLMASLYVFGRTAPPERFAMLASLMVGLGNLGNLLSATPLARSVALFGWRESIVAAGLAMGVAALLVWLRIVDPPKAARADGRPASVLADLAAVLRIRALWLTLPLHLTGYAAVATERGLWVGPYLDQVHGFDLIARGDAAFWMSLGMAAGAIACGPAARLMGGPKTPAVVANAATLALFLTLSLWTGIGPAAAVALLVGVGVFGMSYSLLIAHGRQFVPDHLLGRGVTLLNFFAIGGAGLMQAATGQVMHRLIAEGATPAHAFAAVHLLIAGALALAILPFILARAKP